MRRLFYNWLTTSPALSSQVPVDRWVARGTLEQRPDTVPFVVYVIGLQDRGIGNVRRTTVELWVHDEVGDYTRIDDVLDSVEDRMEELENLEGFGYRILTAEWQGRSGDLSDDALRTSTRNASFRVVGRRL